MVSDGYPYRNGIAWGHARRDARIYLEDAGNLTRGSAYIEHLGRVPADRDNDWLCWSGEFSIAQFAIDAGRNRLAFPGSEYCND